MAHPTITVAICTWNRSHLLAQTLESLCGLEPSDEPWELIVVDNNCTDDTQDVLDRFSDRLPLKSVKESKQGHSHSRNRAVDEASGEFMVWTDDDVLVDSHWLCAYRKAFEAHPDAAFFGGPIEPRFESDPPDWLKTNWERCAGIFAIRALGDTEIALDERRLPFGANFAIRTQIQKAYRFDARYGRVTDSSVRGYDEIDVLSQLVADGHGGFWIPSATVQHFIPTARMSIDYVRRFYEGQGETQILRGLPRASRWRMQSSYFLHELGYACHRLFGRSESWFDHVVKASRVRGQLRKCRQKAIST